MLIEAVVLDAHLRHLHVGRNLVQRHVNAVLIVEVGQHLAVGGQQFRSLPLRRCLQLHGQVVDSRQSVLGGRCGDPDRGHHEAGHQHPAEDGNQNESEQRIEPFAKQHG